MMEQFIWLLPLGIIAGALGSIIGAGGGFILVPVLLFLYPDKSPEQITSISLAVVLANAVSGSIAYAGMKRIDYKSGLIFAVSTIPGSILGASTTSLIDRSIFNGIFGMVMIAIAVFLVFRSSTAKTNTTTTGTTKHKIERSITDCCGTTHVYSYNPLLGIALGLMVGYISSLLGIGGGIIHVPMLVHILGFPIHIATATSLFMLIAMSFSGTLVHFISGILASGIMQIIPLSIGVVLGAQIGARLSKRIDGMWIIRGLAAALAIAGLRIFIMAFKL